MDSITDVVCLPNVDNINTLLDTDSFLIDLRQNFSRELSLDCIERHWGIIGVERAPWLRRLLGSPSAASPQQSRRTARASAGFIFY